MPEKQTLYKKKILKNLTVVTGKSFVLIKVPKYFRNIVTYMWILSITCWIFLRSHRSFKTNTSLQVIQWNAFCCRFQRWWINTHCMPCIQKWTQIWNVFSPQISAYMTSSKNRINLSRMILETVVSEIQVL